MAPVARSSSEQCREGWHAGVPPAHQQLLYARHLTLQRVGTAGDFGKGWGSSWGHPRWGLQPWWLGLGKILAGDRSGLQEHLQMTRLEGRLRDPQRQGLNAVENEG